MRRSGIVEPYSFYQEQTLTGFNIELAKRLGAYLHAKIEYRIYDYGGIITAASSNQIDCILANLNVTKERMEMIDFSDPIYVTYNAVMVADKGADQPSYAAFNGKTAGVITGSMHGDVVHKKLPAETG